MKEDNTKNNVKNAVNAIMDGFNDTANEYLAKCGISKDVDTFLQDASEIELIWFWSHFIPIRKDENGDYYIGDYEYQ